VASFVVPLFVESMAEPEKFFMTEKLNAEDAEEKR